MFHFGALFVVSGLIMVACASQSLLLLAAGLVFINAGAGVVLPAGNIMVAEKFELDEVSMPLGVFATAIYLGSGLEALAEDLALKFGWRNATWIFVALTVAACVRYMAGLAMGDYIA